MNLVNILVDHFLLESERERYLKILRDKTRDEWNETCFQIITVTWNPEVAADCRGNERTLSAFLASW